MSGSEYLADTNAIIYLLNGNACMKSFLRKKLAVSVITFMELLSFTAITAEEEKSIRQFLECCEVISIDEQVREKTISVKKDYRIKLPDAIIVATAMIQGLPLLTAIGYNEVKDESGKKILQRRRNRMTEEELREQEREHQEDLARLRGFRPIDDTFMRCLFRDNLPLAQLVLRIITGIEDLTLISE